MTTYEKRTWLHIALINAVAVLFALLAILAAGCGTCHEVIADVTVTLDGGPASSDGGAARYCAEECETSRDCQEGFSCSPVLNSTSGVKGLCFRDFNADGGK